MKVSWFRNEFDSRPVSSDTSWSEFSLLLTTHDFSRKDKRGLPCFSPAEFKPNAPKKNTEAVVAVHFGVLDLDHITPADVQKVVTAVQGLACAVYSTWRHPEDATKGLARLRAVVPFSRAVAPSEWPGFWPRMVARLGGVCDQKCKDATRIYFGPFMPAGSEAHAIATVFEGAALDVDALLAGAAPTAAATPALRMNVKRDQIAKLAKSWKRAGKDLGDVLEHVANGEPFADAGERDNVLYALCAEITKAKPQWDPDSLADLFAQSLGVMSQEPGAPTVETVREKLQRLYAASESSAPWYSALATTKDGTPKDSLGNAVIVLENHEEWQNVLAFDERRRRAVFVAPPPWPVAGLPRDISDADAGQCAKWFTVRQRMNIGADTTVRAMATVAVRRSFDGFRTYLESLPPWDGSPRLDRWLVDFAGVADSDYARTVGGKWVISAVARTIEPGSKVDTLLILEGKQGLLKSTLLATLAGREWFADRMPDLETKDACQYLQGPVVVEIQELDGFSRKEATAVKAFLSVQMDRFRAPYGHVTEDVPRRCIFAGTTNRETYFTDDTGNRRFWPVAVGERCDIEGLALARDALWSEALARYCAGEAWWLDAQHEALAEAEQEKRQETDAWSDTIRTATDEGVQMAWIDKVNGKGGASFFIQPHCTDISIAELLEHAIKLPVGQWTGGQAQRVGRILTRLGWIRYQKNVLGTRLWRYRRILALRAV